MVQNERINYIKTDGNLCHLNKLKKQMEVVLLEDGLKLNKFLYILFLSFFFTLLWTKCCIFSKLARGGFISTTLPHPPQPDAHTHIYRYQIVAFIIMET